MNKKHIYFIGIKGVAMTALAVYYRDKGYGVSGSDTDETFATDAILQSRHIEIKLGFQKSNISELYDFVVVTGAHQGMKNVEAQQAISLGIPCFMHGKALGIEMDKYSGISVAGCHGKTTTAAMTALIFIRAKLNPSFAVGTAVIHSMGSGGHFGSGSYFIAEADEYVTCPSTDSTPRFLWQHPKILILTNIDYDHPDVYSSIYEVISAYDRFVKNIVDDGVLIACIDDVHIAGLIKKMKRRCITYGFSKQADYRIETICTDERNNIFDVYHQKKAIARLSLSVGGRHNQLNMLAASIAATECGISWKHIQKLSKLYVGSKRRFETIGKTGNMTLVDDYAHHPTEIKATIQTGKTTNPKKKLIVIFQPHTFSRTKHLFKEFSKSFKEADKVILTDIYPSAREKFDSSISSKDLVLSANKVHNNAVYESNKSSVLKWLKSNLTGDEVILTMGAGDIFLWHADILQLMRSISRKK